MTVIVFFIKVNCLKSPHISEYAFRNLYQSWALQERKHYWPNGITQTGSQKQGEKVTASFRSGYSSVKPALPKLRSGLGKGKIIRQTGNDQGTRYGKRYQKKVWHLTFTKTQRHVHCPGHLLAVPFVFTVHIKCSIPHGFDHTIKTYLGKSGVLCKANWQAVIAFDSPMVFLSIQGICTNPPIGSQVMPRWCSHGYFCSHHRLSCEPPRLSVKAAAAHSICSRLSLPGTPMAADMVVLLKIPHFWCGKQELDDSITIAKRMKYCRTVVSLLRHR